MSKCAVINLCVGLNFETIEWSVTEKDVTVATAVEQKMEKKNIQTFKVY